MKRRVILYGAVILVMVTAWSYLVLAPYLSEKDTLEKVASSRRAELHKIRQITLEMPSFLEAKEALETQRVDIDSRLFAKAELLHLFDDIRESAARSNLEVLEISPPVEELLRLNEARSDSLKPLFLNLTVNVAGDYLDFGKYVRELEEADYTRGINRCIISGTPDGSRPLQCTLGFRALLGSHKEAS